jgi:hypothetical protein
MNDLPTTLNSITLLVLSCIALIQRWHNQLLLKRVAKLETGQGMLRDKVSEVEGVVDVLDGYTADNLDRLNAHDDRMLHIQSTLSELEVYVGTLPKTEPVAVAPQADIWRRLYALCERVTALEGHRRRVEGRPN